MHEGPALQWWQTRWLVAVASLLAIVPLLWPTIPPLVDLPGHMGRYRVQLDADRVPHLLQWYSFEWSLIGNLGVDLLVIPFGKIFGLELGVKLIVIAIPALTVAGLLWIAREVHGRIPPTALFALPLAYSYPFQFGFVNFALSMAVALNLFALWLRLARQGRLRLRAIVFVPASCLLWLCHTFGWGVLGVLAFSAEMIRQHDRSVGETSLRGWRRWGLAWIRAGIGCLPLALPMLLMVLWRSGDHVTGRTADWFNWRAKANYLIMVLRDRWMGFDLASVTILMLILFRGVRDERIEYSRQLGLSAAFLLAVFILLPRIVFGSAYADMRLAPFALAIAVIALRPRRTLPLRGAAVLAALGLLFFLVRLGGTTASYFLYQQSYARAFAAIDRVPRGARVVSFVGRRCPDYWAYSRLEHVPALLLERRLAFANDQWSMAGAQLLTTHYPAARGFAHDPSEIVTDRYCRGNLWRPIRMALTNFPRAAFDYVWLLEAPPFDPSLIRGLTPIWRDRTSTLLRVDDRTQPTPLTPEELGIHFPTRLNGVSSPR